jgi:hypothetical protein
MKLISPAIFLAVLLGLAACGGSHPAASHPAPASPVTATSQSVSPAIAADRAVCKVFNANIGDGGEQAIANALVANPSVSSSLAHDIGRALTTITLKANLNAQVKVTLDCAEAHAGATPNE